MIPSLDDLHNFAVVCRSGGYRQAARVTGQSASALSDAIRRLESSIGVALLNRSTRGISTTDAGQRLLAGINVPLEDVWTTVSSLSDFRQVDSGILRLNVPATAARLVLPSILETFLKSHPRISVEVIIDDDPIDIVSARCDAGIRYGELLSDDMTTVPIGPRQQRLITAASPEYLRQHPPILHPRDLSSHACLRHKFPGGAMPLWEFERDGEIVKVDPTGPLTVSTCGADLEIDAALRGIGVVYLFEDWLIDHIQQGALVVVLDEWCKPFDGPRLYFTKRPVLPRPLRLFLDHLRIHRGV